MTLGRRWGGGPVLAAGALFCLLGAGPIRTGPREISVHPDGQINTLAAAVARAAPGDRIVVRAGIYRGSSAVIDKRVDIVGEPGAILDGEAVHEGLVVTADSVTIRGLTIRNVGPSHREDRAAIRLADVTGCVIENNRLEHTFFGIYAARVTDCRIAGNRIEGAAASETAAGNGIHLWSSTRVVVERNAIQGHRDGIYLEFTDDATIRANRSAGNLRYGLHFMFSNRCRYEDNVFADNRAGVAVMYSRQVAVVGNRFEGSRGSAAYGLLLKDIGESSVRDNVLARNSVGLYVEGTTRTEVTGNLFAENGWAIRLMANATANEFRRNRFVGNSFDVTTNSTSSTSVFAENLWDKYTGYDLDRDGYGDVPYHPVRLFALLVERYDPALILLRSPLVDALDLAERAFPVLTPAGLVDARPAMRWTE